MSKAQCIDCLHRYPACHSGCELYKAYHIEIEARAERIRAAKRAENDVDAFKAEAVTRSKRAGR